MAGKLNLTRALRIHPGSRIAFVGAGGKTSTIFHLAREYGNRILITATTHLAADQIGLADRHLIYAQDPARLSGELPQGVTLVTGPLSPDGRTAGVSPEGISALHAWASENHAPLLIEADGARRRALKAPAAHEPVIPSIATDVVVLAGLSAIGKPLSPDFIHRPEIFSEISGISLDETISLEALSAVLLHQRGGLKGIPSQARPVALLNHVSSPELAAEAQRLAARLLPRFHSVVSADIPHYADSREGEIHAAYEPVAAVLLAAGDSKRFGRPKQLLDWRGSPFVRHIAQTALKSGLDPVVVVTGSHAEMIGAALDGLDVSVVHNPDWDQGQSTSVQAGLAALPSSTGAAIFMLSDQPHVPATLLHALTAEHAASFAPIIRPEVDGKRGNPVLFDSSTFPDFADLKGDVGGRAILSRHRVAWLPWLDASLLLDVDTPEDYQRLLEIDP